MRTALVMTLTLAGCSTTTTDEPTPPQLAATEHNAHPEPPAVLRDVALVDDEARFSSPYVPAHRTTMDGRIALRVQGGPPGTRRIAENLSFFLFVPERLEEPILAGPPGAEILADPTPFDVPFPPALEPGVSRFGHHALCDATTPFPRPGERPNPYTCGPDGQHDCYDLTIVSSLSTSGLSTQLFGMDVTVEVGNPKTVDAYLVDITAGEPVAGTTITRINEFTEPAITEDGRLLTGRLGRFPRSWTNPETGETLTRSYDLAYAQLPDDAAPCDVTGWTDFHPLSHAPYDPRMKDRYGLAAYPFRDTEGRPIPDGEDMGGTYPWVDREGANVFMTGIPGRIVEQPEDRYPRRCANPGCEDLVENIDFDRGYMVGGLWTHGKMVHLDGTINHLDWAIGVQPAAHWMVDLYQQPDGSPVSVRLGSGRFIRQFRDAGGPYPAGYTHNANILDSLEHLFHHTEAARPITPRDVVWVMSSGVATDEIAFDDYLDPEAFIVSPMNASITQHWTEDGTSTAIPSHNNGEVRELTGGALFGATELDPEALADIHLQNAATSLTWDVPAYGHIDAGTARIEPAALGGVHGRGLWLSGDAAVRYPVAAQERSVTDRPWYVGLFVDPRSPEGELRTLLRFPDDSALHVDGHARVVYEADGGVVHDVPLPGGGGWQHLGLRIAPGQREVVLLLDGMALDRFEADAPLFQMTPGELVVGRAADPWTGFRGWVDDLVVLAHHPDPEVSCNHANGTLVEVGDDPTWSVIADRHPNWAHGEIATASGVDGRFACFHDHSADHGAHLANLPPGTEGVREAITFPEGPIRYGQPRPDSTDNAFCLSCHTAESKGGLGLGALAYDPGLNAEDDPRRQPSQPPRRVFGNIPDGWMGAEAMQAPPEGVVIDQWVLPR